MEKKQQKFLYWTHETEISSYLIRELGKQSLCRISTPKSVAFVYSTSPKLQFGLQSFPFTITIKTYLRIKQERYMTIGRKLQSLIKRLKKITE